MSSFYNSVELRELGMKRVGENCLVSKKASLYGIRNISLGNNIRIDDFSVLSAGAGGITIGNNVHIAIFCSLQGDGAIRIDDFCGLSSRVAIYSSNDDYLGEYLTNPTIPDNYKSLQVAEVRLKKHAIVGSGSIILPGSVVEEGVAIGALSLVTGITKPFHIYSGNPLKPLMPRSKKLLELEEKYREKNG